MFSVTKKSPLLQVLSVFFMAAVIAIPTWLVATGYSSATETKADSKGKDDLNLIPTLKWIPKPKQVKDAKAKTEKEMKPYAEVISNPSEDITFDMVPIPGGEFVMGSPANEEDREECEGPQRRVKIAPFWMGKCEVTWQEYEQWATELNRKMRKHKKVAPDEYDKLADALTFPTPPYSDMSFGMGKNGYPAICMTQLAAQMYCKWLSAKTGHYYRLPTEAEWEYACRAGTKTAYSFGDAAEELDDYGWYFDNSDEKYQKVGKKKPNPWGLYDMHGNVAEWVIDQYTEKGYPDSKSKVLDNPINMPKKLYPRVVRGGHWDADPEMLRSASRIGSEEEWKCQDPQIPQSFWYHTDANFIGFRIVRPLVRPSVEESKKFEPDVKLLLDEYKKRNGE